MDPPSFTFLELELQVQATPPPNMGSRCQIQVLVLVWHPSFFSVAVVNTDQRQLRGGNVLFRGHSSSQREVGVGTQVVPACWHAHRLMLG